jgi:SAM-dependent methyltransferase
VRDHPRMLTTDVIAFVRASLPPPPSRVLEVGAGRGELAAELRAAGYEVTAIDPAAEPGTGVEPIALIDAEGRFDAAVAIVSLHHVEPLEASCTHLATLIAPGGRLVIDELDIDRYDDRAMEWWSTQRRALGSDHVDHADQADSDPSEIVAHMRAHIHPLEAVRAALRPHFTLGEPVRGPYLHRWELLASLGAVETELIARGRLPATGARLVATRAAMNV